MIGICLKMLTINLKVLKKAKFLKFLNNSNNNNKMKKIALKTNLYKAKKVKVFNKKMN
jgi:hypothetical protein